MSKTKRKEENKQAPLVKGDERLRACAAGRHSLNGAHDTPRPAVHSNDVLSIVNRQKHLTTMLILWGKNNDTHLTDAKVRPTNI